MNCSRSTEATICAFSCRPNSGSEWGVGWNYFLFCARKFDKVRLICRRSEDQSLAIRQYVNENSLHHCELIFLDDTLLLRRLFHRRLFSFYIVLEYLFWQIKCVRKIHSFDRKPEFLLHVTWVSDWLPSYIHFASPARVKIYGPIGSQNMNFNRSYFNSYNIFNIFKRLIRFNPINIINAYNCAGLIAISSKFNERLPWRFVRKRISMTPVNSELEIFSFGLERDERRTINFIGKNLQFKNFDIFVEAFRDAKKNSQVDEAHVFGDFSNNVMEHYPDICFHGVLSQKNVYRILSAHKSIVFQPSCEAGGTIGIEALSYGIPVVTFEGYGLSEFLPENEYQICFKDSWKTKLNTMLNDVYSNYDVVRLALLEVYKKNFTPEINYQKFSNFVDSVNASLD